MGRKQKKAKETDSKRQISQRRYIPILPYSNALCSRFPKFQNSTFMPIAPKEFANVQIKADSVNQGITFMPIAPKEVANVQIEADSVNQGIYPGNGVRLFKSEKNRNIDDDLNATCKSSLVSDNMTEKELAIIEQNSNFVKIPEEIKQSIYEECRYMLTGPFMQQMVCAVCDTWNREENCPVREHSEDLYSRIQNRLAPGDGLPTDLKELYDISNYIPQLGNALLSKRGINKTEGDVEKFNIRVCKVCYGSLGHGPERERRNPPKFSIANGFAIGQLPDHLIDATVTERRLTSLTNIRGNTVIARGGKHRFIKSHFLVFSSQPEVIRQGINDLIRDEDKLLLIFTNPMTDSQRRATMRRYEARKEIVNSLLGFYMHNNVLYQSLNSNGKEMKWFKNLSSRTQTELDSVNAIYDVNDKFAAEEMSEDQSNIRRPTVI